jgi:hypothetical protein
MAYLFVGAGEADFFSPFALDSGIVSSGLPLAVVLIFFPLIFVVMYPLFAAKVNDV